jgi:hypothetical protein
MRERGGMARSLLLQAVVSIDSCSSIFPEDADNGAFGASLARHESDTYLPPTSLSSPAPTAKPSPAAPAAPPETPAPFDPSAALFTVMRATFWATGEELLQRLVSSLAAVLECRVVLAELVTARQDGDQHGLGLWIAEGPDVFRYASMPAPVAPVRDDGAIVAAVSQELSWEGPQRVVAVRSPSGRPLGQLVLSGAPTGGRFGATLLDAVLLAPLAARAGAELARLQPQGPLGPGRLVYMCAWCKGVRDPRHSWHDVESYIRTLTDAAFTHGICPDCSKERV